MLKLTITTAEKNLNMEVQDVSEEAKNHAVMQAFALFGAITPTQPEPPAKQEIVTAQAQVPVAVAEESVEVEPAVTYQAPPRPVYKPVHLQNKVETKAETMVEAVNEIKELPDHIKTGIKIKGGKPAYKCRYICPKCGHKGNHYIWPNTQQVDCWGCQTSMVVTKAVKGVTLMPDKHQNFYVAGDQLAVIDLTYANQKEKINILKKNNLLDKDFKGNV